VPRHARIHGAASSVAAGAPVAGVGASPRRGGEDRRRRLRSGCAGGGRGRIFDPFFTTREPGKGTGLGLAIVLRIVENFQGIVWVQPAREGGAAFHVLFPLAPRRPAHLRSRHSTSWSRFRPSRAHEHPRPSTTSSDSATPSRSSCRPRAHRACGERRCVRVGTARTVARGPHHLRRAHALVSTGSRSSRSTRRWAARRS
jgi:hypothetical protein